MQGRPSPIRKDILNLARARDITGMSYREIAKKLDIKHPYSVQQAMRGMIDSGVLLQNKDTGAIYVPDDNSTRPKLFTIPVLGHVSCGPPTSLADDFPTQFLEISPSVANIRNPQETYALIAAGDSMTASSINGKTVDDGDYIIVERRPLESANNKDYVVSRFGDVMNLKRLHLDPENRRLILMSESTEKLPPIVISEEDRYDYTIDGVAVDVIKGLPA